MRYYRVVISSLKTGQIYVPNINGVPGFSWVAPSAGVSSYTSLNAGMSLFQFGSTNMNAQLIEMDMPVTFAHAPGGGTLPFLKLSGVSQAEISQAANLQGYRIQVFGGMAAGLPLANPQQAGLLCDGVIWQAYGINYGQEKSLNIYVNLLSSQSSNQTTANPATPSTVPVGVSNATPANITFQWVAGQPLITAIQAALSTAFPQYSLVGAIDPNLVRTGAAATGFSVTLNQFARYINATSLSVLQGFAPNRNNYRGVTIAVQGQTIVISDGTTIATPKQLQYLDLQGQPTWVGISEVQVTTTMRGDLNVGDYIVLPNGPGQITAGSNSQFYGTQGNQTFANVNNGTIFAGTFQVQSLRHVGNSRGPAGSDWITLIDLFARTDQQPTTVAALPVIRKGTNTYTQAAA